jgi:YebC/PmpR family DNA-binding regulatory protein
MSGHSRWAGIKHKKAIIDAKRGKVFTRLIREITIAAKHGGGKIESNPRLRSAIEAGKAANMPQDNIKRAVQKGTGEIPGVSFDEVVYEGYGPAGVAVYVEATTDNKNRTTAEIRHLFADFGGNMGELGCVSWMFENRGTIRVPKASMAEDKIMELALELGADDIKSDTPDAYEILTSAADFESVKNKLIEAKVNIESAEVGFIPKNTVRLEGEDADRCLKFIEALDEHEDVKNVSANFDISDDVMEKLSGAS